MIIRRAVVKEYGQTGGFGLENIYKAAVFSKDRLYRYTLVRIWNRDLPILLAVMLNPSTADADKDDPTNRKVGIFARRWEFGGFVCVNLFAFRATDPKKMLKAKDPTGPHNDYYIRQWAERAGKILVAWGNHGRHQDRDMHVEFNVLDGLDLYCLRTTKGGCPEHPLYVPKNTPLSPWGGTIPF